MAIVGSITLGVTIVTALPKAINEYRTLFGVIKEFSSKLSNKATMVIDEFHGHDKNEIYEAVEIYLGNNFSLKNRKLRASKTEKEKNSIKVTLEHKEKVKDVYDGHKFKWTCLCEGKSFKLKFRKKDKDFVLESYLPYIMKEAKYLKR